MAGGIKVQVRNQSLGDMLDVAVEGEQQSKPGQQYQQAFRRLVYGNGAKRLNQSQSRYPARLPTTSASGESNRRARKHVVICCPCGPFARHFYACPQLPPLLLSVFASAW